MTEPSHAVFLSYASQDAQGARRICDALRAAGIEVFLDQSELRGGEVWDQTIRREIHACALFIPVVSQHTQERLEGYFRLEWDLADQRTHMMARNRVFIVPVCVDATPDAGADVPESFQRVQWMRLPGGEASPEFVARIKRLLALDSTATAVRQPKRPVVAAALAAPLRIGSRRLTLAGLAAVAILASVAGYFIIGKYWAPRHAPVSQPVRSPAALPESSAGVSERSIAVLPFVNMSPDKDQEYFADGLSEELIDHLAHAADLKVIARTSSFQFKGKNEDLRAVAGKLGVAHLLEGSVRKSGKILRITAQLIRASDGSHLWSQTYERELRDVFRVQDEIAATVTRALNVAMGPSAKPGRASTSTAEAYNLVMQGNFFKWRQNRQDMERAVGLYREAIRLDPDYALPWARLGAAYFNQATRLWIPRDDGLAKAHKALQRAIELDPDLIWAHYTLGGMYFYAWDWSAVRVEDDRVRAIDPQNFLVLSAESDLASTFGPIQEAVDIELRIVNRDPLAAYALGDLADRQRAAGHLQESLTTSQRLLAMTPQYAGAQSSMGLTRLLLGDYAQALVDVQKEPEEGDRLAALPLIYWAMGRRREADAALLELIQKRATVAPYDIASVYAYRHEVDTAFEWLDRAYVQRDAGMTGIKFDPFVRNLRNDPRYKAMLKKMNLPE